MKKLLTFAVAIIASSLAYAQTLNESQGTGSGQNISSGDYNTFYGDSSAASVSSGSLNTIIGFKAGFYQTTAFDNVFIGAGAGGGTTTGTDNVVIGTKAGGWGASSPNSSGTQPTGAMGTDNVVIGTEAGMVMEPGASDNTIIGEEAGQALTSGDDNVFIGEDAGYNSTTSSDNTFVGSTAGRQNTTGYRNTFIGNQAGYDNTTGYWNTFVGDSSGIDGSTGIANTMLGHASGPATEYGSHNTFIGNNAGWDNNRTNVTSGQASFNTYLGSEAGRTNRTGNGNVMIGYEADFEGVGSNGTQNSDNVLIGRFSSVGSGHHSAISIGSYSRVTENGVIAIGFDTDVTSTFSTALGYNADISGTNSTAIGYSASATGARVTILGTTSSALDNDATAIGYNASADSMSVALGSNSFANGSYSAAIGAGASTSQNNSMVLGGATSADRVSVGIGTTTPNVNASLTLDDTDKGFLVNRLTTTLRTTLGGSMSAADQGMIVYDTDEDALYTWNGTDWNSATNTDSQDLSLSGNTLSLTNDGTTVDLSGYLDNTDTQLTEAEVDAFVANNGYLTSFSEVDGDPTNEIQDISLSGTNLSLTSGSTIDLSVIDTDTDTQLTEAEVDAFVANNGYLTSFSEVDGDPTNEIQDISLSGTDLSLTSGSTIDLSVIDTDTDTQLSEAEVDAFVANNGYLTSFSEVDGDPTNEIQDISLSGTDLTLSSGSTIDLSVIDTDTDTQLSEAEVDAFVANNGYLTTFTELDGDPTNEIQDISLSGTDLTLSSGSTIDLSVVDTDTDTQLTEAEVDAFVANNGYLTTFTELDGDPANEIQDISLSGTDLTLSSGSTIDLSVIDTDTDTDEQNLTAATLTGNILQIDIENGTSVSVDLSPMLASIEAQLIDHETRITELEACACDSTAGVWGGISDPVESAILYQNIPNPFNNTSSIKYYIPSYANSANLVISNSMGQLISNIKIKEVGEYGTAHVNAEGLAAGTYYYTLYVNQTLIDTKKMVVE